MTARNSSGTGTMFSKSTFVLRSDPGATELLSSIREAEWTRDENPVWLRNRPLGWKRSRDRLYFAALALAWGLLPFVVLTITIGRIIPSFSILLFVSIFLTIALCYSAYGLIHTFDFFRGRRWVLEDLHMTRLGAPEIAYGAFHTGVRVSVAVLLPLLIGECCLWFRMDAGEGMMCIFLVMPTQAVVTCYAIQFSLGARSAFRPVDYVFLMALPLACILHVAVWLAIAAAVLLAAGMLLTLLIGDPALTLFFVAIPAYAVIASHWGYRLIDKSWLTAANNIRAQLDP